jgi:orotate phosphoribosyltransferase
MSDRQRLKEILLEKSYRKGTFTLTSGKTSDFYIDGKQTTLSAEGAYLCGKLLFELIRQEENPIEAVGGMTLGADPLVTAVSLVSFLEKEPIPAFIVRKEAKGHGTGNYIEGLKNMPEGCTVALIEDVVTTGGTLLKVIERVEAQGFKVGLVATVVERQEGGVETLDKAGYTLKAIFTRAELLDETR